jgi:hypothetical protein
MPWRASLCWLRVGTDAETLTSTVIRLPENRIARAPSLSARRKLPR